MGGKRGAGQERPGAKATRGSGELSNCAPVPEPSETPRFSDVVFSYGLGRFGRICLWIVFRWEKKIELDDVRSESRDLVTMAIEKVTKPAHGQAFPSLPNAHCRTNRDTQTPASIAFNANTQLLTTN